MITIALVTPRASHPLIPSVLSWWGRVPEILDFETVGVGLRRRCATVRMMPPRDCDTEWQNACFAVGLAFAAAGFVFAASLTVAAAGFLPIGTRTSALADGAQNTAC